MSLEEHAEDAHVIAQRVLYELLGRRWVWPAVTTIERTEIPSGQAFLILHGRPVIDIESVVLYRGNAVAVDLAYVLENKFRLRFTDIPQLTNSRCWGSSNAVEVTYTYGSPPPAEIEAAIEALAEQITLAYEGSEECLLPTRVTSLSRNGMNMSFLDPRDFLEKGLTGVDIVDQAIKHFNSGNAQRPARVYSVNSPPPRRRNTSQASGS